MNLTLLHTNDLHGHVDELACLTTTARRLRGEIEAAGGHCLLVDCGDAEERSVLEMSVTQGRAAMAYLRAAGYDLSAVGNGAALSFGPQVLPDLAETAGFPLLAANLLDEEGKLAAGCTASVLKEIGGVGVGFIGLAPRWNLWTLFGIQDLEPAPIVRAEIDRLRAAGAKVIILLSHLGLAEDMLLLMQVQGVDVILGGHSHTTIFGGLVQNNTLVAQAGEHGRYLGRVDLEIDEESGELRNAQAGLLPLNLLEEPDPAVLAAVDEQQALVAEILAEAVGESRTVLKFDALGESSLANLMADAIRDRTGADVAIFLPAQLQAGLPAGVITLRHVYRACKSPGNPAWRTLSGAQLLEMLETGLDVTRAERQAPWGRGRPTGRVAVSGLSACYDANAPAGQRLSDVLIGGDPLDPTRVYKVGGSDAELTGLGWQDATHQNELSFQLDIEGANFEAPTVIRDVLEAYIRQHSPITPPAVGRITIV